MLENGGQIVHYTLATQCVFCEPAALGAPERLLEIQNLWSHPRSTESASATS